MGDEREAKRLRTLEADAQDDHEELLARRDDLTVMVRQLHPKVTDFDVFELFSKAGKVNDVRLITEERTGKCQGVGYVEMADPEGMMRVLMLNGQMLKGIPILVQASLAEKNRVAAAGGSTAEIVAAGNLVQQRMGLPSGNPNAMGTESGIKLYVGSLHYNIEEAQITELFSPFGTIEKVDLHREPHTGHSKGYCFVHFKRMADGKKCMEQMDGFELAGRPMKVTLSSSESGTGAPPLAPMNMVQTAATNTGDNSITALDDCDENASFAGGRMNTSTRASIMAKLAQNAGMEVPEQTIKAAVSAANVQPVGVDGNMSRCVILKNMFDRCAPEVDDHPGGMDGYFKELADDVKMECQKFGVVLHVSCDKWSNGFVYIKFAGIPEAVRCKERMHGRFFAKSKILAEMITEYAYDKKWPKAKIM